MKTFLIWVQGVVAASEGVTAANARQGGSRCEEWQQQNAVLCAAHVAVN